MEDNSNLSSNISLPEPRSSGLFINLNGCNFILIGGGNREKAFNELWQLNCESNQIDSQVLLWHKLNMDKNIEAKLRPRFGHCGIIHKKENEDEFSIYIHGGQNHFLTGTFYLDFFQLKFNKNQENIITMEDPKSQALNELKANSKQISNCNSKSNSNINSKNNPNAMKIYTCYEIQNLIKFPVDIVKTPCERNSHTMAFDQKDSLYIFGGGNSSGLLSDLWKYSIENNLFSKIDFDETKIPPREMHGMIYYKDFLYIFGGRLYDAIDKKVYRINLNTSHIDSDFTTLPMPLCSFSYALYKNYLVIYGGTDGINFLSTIYIYNINNNKWAKSKLKLSKSSDKEAYLSEGKIGSHMAIDEENEIVLIFGGSSIQQDSNAFISLSLKDLLNENNLTPVLFNNN